MSKSLIYMSESEARVSSVLVVEERSRVDTEEGGDPLQGLQCEVTFAAFD